MDKKRIIVQEIEKWRKSKLLPEQYCDFLLNLYQDRNEESAAAFSGPSSLSRYGEKTVPVLSACVILAVLSFISFYFSSFSLALQILISVVTVAGLYLTGFLTRNRHLTGSYLAFGAGSVLLLFSGPYIMKLHGAPSYGPAVYVMICSLVWIFMGWISRLGLLQFCGWAGILLFYGWMVHTRFDQMHWMQLELHWVPLSFLFGWAGWLVHRRWKTSARVFFLLALLLYGVPEAVALFGSGNFLYPGLGLAVKLLILAIGLYFCQERWKEWVV